MTTGELHPVHPEPDLVQRAAVASVATALVIAGLKLAGALVTGSMALLASLADSVADLAASAITLLSVRIAAQPPDRHHRFGHGKAEALAAIAQGTLVAGATLLLAVEAVRRLLEPRPPEVPGVGVSVMLASMALTVALIAYQRRVVRRTGSRAIDADSLHYRTDLLSNGVVLAALLAAQAGFPAWLDPLVALGIAAWLFHGSWRIVRGAVDELMDRELPPDVRERVLAVVWGFPEVRGVHDLRTRRSGHVIFVEMHAEFDPDMPLREAHAVTERIETAVRRELPGAVVVIHQEPAGLPHAKLDRLIARQEG
ncbi:Ferrous-iron efflux pump FieF [bacterium HR39]|nr:Ferrous-iron efflux pump FieF [bacterium HR39]